MSTLSKSERQALNDIFLVIDTKEDFSSKLKDTFKMVCNLLLFVLRSKKRI